MNRNLVQYQLIMKEIKKRLFDLNLSSIYYFYISALLICFISYVITPFTGDIRVFYSSAILADHLGDFPYNIDSSWEIKPIGNRLIVYLLYKFTVLFAEIGEKTNFEITTKIIISVISVAVILAFVFRIKNIIEKYSISTTQAFIVTTFSLFSISYFCALQTENFCVILILLSFYLILSKSKILNFLSGFTLALLFALKVITIILALYVFVAIYYLGEGYRKNLRISLKGFIVSMILIVSSIVFVFPYALSDISTSTLYQNTFNNFNIISRLLLFFVGSIRSYPHIPVLLPSIYVSLITLSYLIWDKKYKEVIIYSSLWLIGIVPIIVQGKFFAYHYLPLVIPAIYSFFYFKYIFKEFISTLNKKRLIYLSLLLFLMTCGSLYITTHVEGFDYKIDPNVNYIYSGLVAIVYMIFSILIITKYNSDSPEEIKGYETIHTLIIITILIWVIFNSFSGYLFKSYYEYSIQELEVMQKLDERYELSSEPSILYLTDGACPYYISSKSYCRYFYPLPVQRANNNPKLYGTQVYKDTLDCILNYSGNYIIVQSNWFDLNLEKNKPIKEKIDSNYEIVDETPTFEKHYIILKKK